MKIIPSENKILVKLIEEKETSENGIITPAPLLGYSKGKIIAISNICCVEDIVIFSGYGTKIEIDGEEYRVVDKDDILVTITEEGEQNDGEKS